MALSPVLIIVAVLFVVVVAAGLGFLRRAAPELDAPRESRAPELPPAKETRDRIFFLRFEGNEDVAYVGELIARHNGRTTDTRTAREMALDLVRAAPTATHVQAGPAVDAVAGPGVARCGLSGGIIAGFRVVSTKRLGTVADDRDLAAVVEELRAVASFTDADLIQAELVRATPDVDATAPALVAVREESRPGHQRCTYCRHSFPAHDTRCPSCGAPVGR